MLPSHADAVPLIVPPPLHEHGPRSLLCKAWQGCHEAILEHLVKYAALATDPSRLLSFRNPRAACQPCILLKAWQLSLSSDVSYADSTARTALS